MNKHILAAFLVIMLISCLSGAKSTFGQKVKQAAEKAYNKIKEIAGKAEYG